METTQCGQEADFTLWKSDRVQSLKTKLTFCSYLTYPRICVCMQIQNELFRAFLWPIDLVCHSRDVSWKRRKMGKRREKKKKKKGGGERTEEREKG